MSIEAIDLNLLNVLHVVLAERSVVGASRRLHVTPSAVSNSLSRLRALLGDPIVTRRGRGIVPTPRAAELAPVVERALRELERAVFAAPFDPATCTRRFTLAVADAGQLVYVPPIAQRMASVFPEAQLRIVSIDALVALGDLASSEIDVHIGMRDRGPGLHHEPLLEEHAVLIARRNHPITRARNKRPLLDAARRVHVEMVAGRGHSASSVTVPTFTAAAAVVASTDLVATVPASFARAYAVRLGVVVVGGVVPTQPIPIVLQWHERTQTDPASIAFRKLIKATFERTA